MNDLFKECSDIFVIEYLKDVLIHGCSLEDHKKHIELVLDRLCAKDLYVKVSKCKFGDEEVEYLGVLLRAGKLTMNQNRTRATKV